MNFKNGVLFSLITLALFTCKTAENNAELLPPEENRFTTTILSQPGDLDEPMAFTFLNESEMLIVERKGGVKSFNVETRRINAVGIVPVNTKYVNKEGKSREAEEGLVGIIAHPDFQKNHWIFMLYADPAAAKHVLARWEYRDGKLLEASKKIVLEYPAQREVCCHTGGGMVFDKKGNLFLTTGNNTANPRQGTSNLNETPGKENADDQRTAGNANDLRGKILRIHPEDDGSYTIPDGNLFPEGTPDTRPEIYTMGHRNPWRVSIDHQTGYIYWGEVGPDASEDTEVGPKGYDEFNQAKGPGFFGWPYFIGDNIPYVDSLGNPFDPEKPVNNSPNNTGIKALPAAQKAFIWYPYSFSETFPLLGSAGRSATGGPVFRQADFPKSDKRFPAYYEGKWLITDFMRGWIMAVTMDEQGNYVSMEPFLPKENFPSAIDIQFSPDGDLYVLEYGTAWFRGNSNAHIKRIQYNGGNRPPVVQASADTYAGAVPLRVSLSSEGTLDYDKDQLSYSWEITSKNGFSSTLTEDNPSLTLEKEGVYTVSLRVSDPKGKSDQQTFEIIAGNAPPQVDIHISQGNSSFFFPESELTYAIQVEDLEDGSAKKGNIPQEEIAINFDYVPAGFDPIEIAQNHRSSDEWVVFSKGQNLIKQSDCFSCHRMDIKSLGPSYQQVAEKYKGDPNAKTMLAERIIKGGVGVWGEHAMSAHPDLSQEDAETMVAYILGLNTPKAAIKSIPLQGTHTLKVPEGDPGNGGYLLRVAYQDKGTAPLKAITTEKIVALRNPNLNPAKADMTKGFQILSTPRYVVNAIEHNAYLAFQQLDLTGIKEIVLFAEASTRTESPGGMIEIRIGSPTGTLLGSTGKIEPLEIDVDAELKKMKEEWEKNGKKGREPNNRMVWNKFRPKFPVPIQDMEGKQDIYFVVKNPEATPGETLIQFKQITFKNTSSIQ